ncbi:MAG: DUF711 family protein [Chloroflexi bacterium]|nr:DUF711 family protein [Chloroflexota bacterium]
MKPVIRTITGFISTKDSPKLDRLVDTVLAVRDEYRLAGYEVQTVRITTDILEQNGGIDSLAGYESLLSQLERNEDVSFYHLGALEAEAEANPESEERLVDAFMNHPKAFMAVDAGGREVSKALCLSGARICKGIASISSFECRRFGVYGGVTSSAPFYPASKVLGNSLKFGIGSQCANLAVEEAARSKGDMNLFESSLQERMNSEFARMVEVVPPGLREQFIGCDTSLAPYPADEVSIANAIEIALGKPFGSSGTLSVCRLLTRVMQNVDVPRTGLCGLMLPVVEDNVLGRRGVEGRYSWKELLLYSAVCATGLDTVPISGRTSVEDLADCYHDLATMAVKLGKPLSARFFVEPEKLPGETVTYDWEFAAESPVLEI